MIKEIKSETTEDKPWGERPRFYQSPVTVSGAVSRLRGANVKSNLPRITEFLSGSFKIEADGTGRTTVLFNTANRYAKPPLVVGIVVWPDGRVQPTNLSKFPSVGIGAITRTGAEVRARDFASDIGETISFKLRVYNLDLV